MSESPDSGSVEARERELARKATAAVPYILEQLEAGKEPVEVSSHVAANFDLDDRQAFKWVQITEERFLKKSKALSGLGLVLLWTGMLAILAAGVLVVGAWNTALFGPISVSGFLAIVGGVLAAPGVVLTFFARPLIARNAGSLF